MLYKLINIKNIEFWLKYKEINLTDDHRHQLDY